NMKPATKNFRNRRAVILLGTLAALVATLACSGKPSKQAVSSPVSSTATVTPVELSTVVPVVSQPSSEVVKSKKSDAVKSGNFLSRDYGVSFHYPWQYAFLSARAVANGDSPLKARSDGHDGQFTLARVEIPQGFYPDTDFESGYFTLSLNENLNEQECLQTLSPAKDAKLDTVSIQGQDFHWIETSSAGHGEASLVRNYVSFESGTCYEIEMGVKTANKDGMARELNPDLVMSRLDSILQTVKIVPASQPAASAVESSAAASPEVSPR
ncbi:MAG TPA: hypothetical protein VJP83_11385, partial [Terriglobales bacterium]|nr:hypothetical protein [Terriglobales bacterium]